MMFQIMSDEHWFGEADHMMIARAIAQASAQRESVDVVISAAGKDRLVAHPDGTFSPPPGAALPNERERCRRPEACFCSPCRAARRS